MIRDARENGDGGMKQKSRGRVRVPSRYRVEVDLTRSACLFDKAHDRKDRQATSREAGAW